jgi:hypothetical protein
MYLQFEIVCHELSRIRPYSVLNLVELGYSMLDICADSVYEYQISVTEWTIYEGVYDRANNTTPSWLQERLAKAVSNHLPSDI